MSSAPTPHVRVVSSLSASLGALGLPRNVMVAALATIHALLPADAATARANRVPGLQHAFFYDRILEADGRPVRLRFTVGDAGWPDLLWVVAVERIEGGPLDS